jgi:two-component system OmpR family sensor kinase
MEGKAVLLRSLRSKILLVLVGAALIAAASGAVLTVGITQADRLSDRAHLSQNQLELLLLLAGRVSDFGLVATEAARLPQSRAMIASAGTEVSAVFDLIEASIEKQVSVLAGDERNAEAAEGLSVARMRAMFQSISRQIGEAAERISTPDDRVMETRRLMDVFGLGFAPILSQAVETERREAQKAWGDMTALKHRLLIVAGVLAAGALLLALLLYLGPVRSVLTRLRQTVEGAEAIAAGRLDTRLPSGGGDELAGLMSGFNRMAETLGEREARILAAQRDLQRVIDERTAELREANRRLEEIDSNRRRFFADVSHELRTPLTVILGEAELLLRRGDPSPELCRASMETIQNRARRLNRRIDDMLRVARSESGRLELRLSETEAGQIAADAVEDTLALAKHGGIEVRLERGPGDLYVHGDRDWLRQVCGGLISNAIKFSSPPGPIEVLARRENGAAVLEVSDRGRGIDEGDRRRVFDRFFRGENRAGQADTGHGVGLALANWIIDEHKGKIELQSPGRLYQGYGAPGTTVILRLNLAEDDNDRERDSDGE